MKQENVKGAVRRPGIVLVAIVSAMVLQACGTKRNPEVCHFEPCADGFVCDSLQRCVPIGDGGIGDAMNGDGPLANDATTDALSGDAMGSCSSSKDCKVPTAPLCNNGACFPCGVAPAMACGNEVDPLKPLCAPTGECVACLGHADCPAATPICSADKSCVSCNSAAATADSCGRRDPAKAVCAKAGAAIGQCVECEQSASCTASAAPICDTLTNRCRRCEQDAECIAKAGADPGVCMAQDDGRCATSAETVKVEGGDLQAAITSAVSAGKKLVLVTADSDRATFAGPGKLSIVGKINTTRPVIGGGTKPALTITGGDLYLRDLLITVSTPGISAAGGTLRMSSCEVKRNVGGILLNGAAFDIQNTEISDNEIGTYMTSKWGGLLTINPGSPKRLSQVKVVNNKQTGVVCSAPITLNEVMASGNVGENIALECQ